MEVVLLLGLIWLVLATGVVCLCAAASAADAQSADLRGHARRRRHGHPGARLLRRPACAGARLARRSRPV